MVTMQTEIAMTVVSKDPNNGDSDPLAGLVGQRVSVLLAVAGRTVTATGILHRITGGTIILRSVASRTRGRETMVMRAAVVCVQAVEQPQAEIAA